MVMLLFRRNSYFSLSQYHYHFNPYLGPEKVMLCGSPKQEQSWPRVKDSHNFFHDFTNTWTRAISNEVKGIRVDDEREGTRWNTLGESKTARPIAWPLFGRGSNLTWGVNPRCYRRIVSRNRVVTNRSPSRGCSDGWRASNDELRSFPTHPRALYPLFSLSPSHKRSTPSGVSLCLASFFSFLLALSRSGAYGRVALEWGRWWFLFGGHDVGAREMEKRASAKFIYVGDEVKHPRRYSSWKSVARRDHDRCPIVFMHSAP